MSIYAISDSKNAAIKAFTQKEQTMQFSNIENQGDWGYLVSIYAPIFNSGGRMVGVLGCDFDAEDLQNGIRTGTIRHILLGLCFLTIGLGLLFFFLRLIFNRIERINSHLNGISRGEGDLTQRIKILHDDEIGELGKHFNIILETIKSLVVAVRNRSAFLLDTGNKLSENMRMASAIIKEIAENIQDIKRQVISQSASVVETSATMERMTINIDRLNSNAEKINEEIIKVSKITNANKMHIDALAAEVSKFRVE